jgi:D-lactate dehydrogenase
MQVKDKVAVHVPCSSKKMGIEAAFMNIASRCAKHVQPSAVPCCGMAGDRGMRCARSPLRPHYSLTTKYFQELCSRSIVLCLHCTEIELVQYMQWHVCSGGRISQKSCRYPELTAASLQHLNTQGCSDGYSTSRTCEMSLSNHSGIHFRGLVYLVDQATTAKAPSV